MIKLKLMKGIKVLFIIATLIICALSTSYTCIAQSNSEGSQIPELVSNALSNPKVLVTIAIQFLLGLSLGYFSVKVIKYILALIGILILGSFLSVWSLGGSIDEFLLRIGVEAQKVLPLIRDLLSTLGILTIGPVTIGFIAGIIVGSLRK
ncbi:MAG: hypothetical protein DRJ66_04765 [Thermoprotei archaeon]|nr:MAG: hypothetical protein DRJ66_04765 [Thermoprotei archaeon]RLF20842.1 MAG: hypothetical protein DRZ82_01005 [Thermoprotei archaeon]